MQHVDPARSPVPAAPHFDAAFAARFEDLLRWRRDVRHFRRDPLAPADMEAILASVAFAPSVGNSQPWRIVHVRSRHARRAVLRHVEAQNDTAAQAHEATGRGAAYRALKLHGLVEAPEVMAVFCDEAAEAGHGLGRATMPEALRYSCVTAIHTMWLTARLRGIGMGWVSILQPAVLAGLLDVPARWSLVALLCIGHPLTEDDVPELERRGWQAREALAARLFER